jgi:polysaccharide biosynthesis transport protein
MRHKPDLPRLEGPGTTRDRGSPGVAEVQQYIDALRRRWWIIAAAVLIAVAVAWWGERDRVPVYSAEALVEHRRDAPLVGSMGIGQGGEFGSQLEMIRSRTVVSLVIDSLGLQLDVGERRPQRTRILARAEVQPDASRGSYTLERNGDRLVLRRAGSRDTLATATEDGWVVGPDFRLLVRDPSILDEEPLLFHIQDRQVAVERLQGRVRVEPGRASGLVRIGYQDPDPEMAAAVVNTMARAYQDQRASAAREAVSRRREVIAEQLVGLADSLTRAQDAVVEYQREARLMDPGYEGGQVMASVLQVENELRTLRFQEGLLSSLAAGVRDEEAGDQSLDQILSLGADLVPAGPALHNRLQNLQMDRARMTASTFGRMDGDPEVQIVDSLIASTKAQMRSAVEQGLDHLRTRIRGAEQRLGQMRGAMATIPGQTAELARLRQRADAVQDVVDVLVDRYYEAQIAEAVEAGDVAIVDSAPVPLWPNPAQTRLVLMFGLIGGLMVGGLGALLLEFLDFRVRRAADAEEVTGLPLVGMVPKLGAPSRDPVAAAIGKEAFRSLRVNLHYAHGEAPRILSVTSATPKEGKTTVCVNLAASLAEQQGPGAVLVIDADLRRPQLHTIFGMGRSPGLSDVLNGTVDVGAAIRTCPSHPTLHVLTSGSAVTNPSEIIGSRSLGDLIDTLGQQFEFMVIDTPPLLAVTDAAVIAKVVDGTLMVVRADQADRVAVATAMEQLRQIDATLLGVILNGVGTRSSDGRHQYAYYDEYLADTPGNPGRVRKHTLLGAGS